MANAKRTKTNSSNNLFSKENRIGALWEREGKRGKLLSGVATHAGKEYRIVLLPNTYKVEGDKRPDWNIFMALN